MEKSENLRVVGKIGKVMENVFLCVVYCVNIVLDTKFARKEFFTRWSCASDTV